MPTRTTVSTCTAVTDQGKHVFEIFDYSQHRGMGHEMLITSGTFYVGGHDWAIRFYPNGFEWNCRDCISVYLELLGEGAVVSASCDLRLVDQTTGSSSSLHNTPLREFSSDDDSRFAPETGMFMNRSKLESSDYLRDDHLTIQCIVTVKKAPLVSATAFLNRIEAPPSNITEQLGKLLDAEEGTEVTFSVGGETFAAHKMVLAMRSPVFRAELYGPMSEATAQRVTIQDMQPAVFRALLHFLYTDSLPGRDRHGGDADRDLIWHLLEAADGYAVGRLSLLCQSILSENLDVETVATTLALACQHNCDPLKDVCLDFISSSHVMNEVVATQGFKNLKTTCPALLLDVFQKTMRFHSA
ncbi:hypothetical protein GQ55_6G074500 [Panicum hallii var. hallii]|uniref:BTB domain-containing protein n=1 Tax=Panicum hallii var. hallii TaxID=1504633 RepID=A0A2T7D4W8_9POAL|nr:hypothetical protein GQ55_6G074500 [Panicum hallii var. hallii]